MKIDQLTATEQERFSTWLSSEWTRCASMLNAFEGHAITFLTAANGGGAATLIAFAGSAGYSVGKVYTTLGLFLNGLLLVGIAVAAGFFHLRSITRGLGDDHKRFNSGSLASSELTENHSIRFGRYSAGEVLAVGSFLCFVAGLTMSFWTFRDYQDFKEDKDKMELAKAEAGKSEDTKQVIHVSCIQPAIPTEKTAAKK